MALSPGDVLNTRYRIVKLLGAGGFGAVYRAWDINMNGTVAIKENLDSSPDSQRQFTREASLLFTLHHSNLPKVFDMFEIPGQGQYLVMEYVDGEDLRSLVDRNGPMKEAEILPWLIQVCQALEYLHTYRDPIIHRDVKPANIKINSSGQAVLVDFGIAKVYASNRPTTQGARAITPGYSPIEQYGSGGTAPYSDTYALGATIYTLLTGNIPVESVDRNVGKALVPARSINPQISVAMDRLINKAMELQPPKRFQNAREMRIALEKVDQVSGKTRVTSPMVATVSASTKAGKSRKSGITIASFLTLIGLIALLPGLWKNLFDRRDPANSPTPTIARTTLAPTITVRSTQTMPVLIPYTPTGAAPSPAEEVVKTPTRPPTSTFTLTPTMTTSPTWAATREVVTPPTPTKVKRKNTAPGSGPATPTPGSDQG